MLNYPVTVVAGLKTHVCYNRKQYRKWTSFYKGEKIHYETVQTRVKKTLAITIPATGRSYPVTIRMPHVDVLCKNHKEFHARKRAFARQGAKFTVIDHTNTLIEQHGEQKWIQNDFAEEEKTGPQSGTGPQKTSFRTTESESTQPC